MNNKSPLRYPGGKSRACKILDDILQNYYDPVKFTTLISLSLVVDQYNYIYIIEAEWSYSMNKSIKSSEIIILSIFTIYKNIFN